MEDKIHTHAVDGQVLEEEWIDEKTLFVYVEDEDGNVWREQYEFEERVPSEKSKVDFTKVN